MATLYFLDCTCGYDQNYVKNRAIGASEYQAYNLLENLSSKINIICYNNRTNNVQISNIQYKSYRNDLINDTIDINSKIIIQRMIPNLNTQIYEKIKNNKIFIWIHDLTSKNVFLFNYSKEEKLRYEDNDIFKDEILKIIYENKNINFVFVSNFIKNKFKKYFEEIGFILEENRLYIIYNMLYEDEFLNKKKEEIKINYNYITYASAWSKGIDHVIKVFDYVKSIDNNMKLVLLSPGYDWYSWTQYIKDLKNKYNNDIIIHGPVDKIQYSNIIKESLLVMTTKFAETFGCVFAESYYLGTPVIADIRSGAVSEIIDNNFIVDYNNLDQTYEKIKYVRDNRDNIKVKLDEKFMYEYNINLWFNLIK